MIDRVTPGERLAGIAGLVLLLVMFLFAWYGFEGAGFDAFDAFDDWVNIILVLTAFAAMSLALFGTGVARVPAPMSTITTVLGAVSSVIVLIFLISPPGVPTFGVGASEFDAGRKFGVWLGLASAIAVAIGGYMAMQEEGTTFDEAADRLSRRPRPAEPGAATPPPPPPPSTGPGGPPASA
jgi:hypothetical protein